MNSRRELLFRVSRVAAAVCVVALVLTVGNPRPDSSRQGSQPFFEPARVVLPEISPSSMPLGSPSHSAVPSASPSARKPSPSPKPKKTTAPIGESVGGPAAPAVPSTSSSSSPKPKTVEDYLALVPSFPPRPSPVKVNFSHPAGSAAFITNVPTSQPVAFITIDDGYWNQKLTHDLIKRSGIPVTSFLTSNAIEDDTAFFASLKAGGMTIQNHSTSHPCLTRIPNPSAGFPCTEDMPYDGQFAELCGASDQLQSWFGQRPSLFRSPYLQGNDVTLRAAWDCGMKANVHGTQSIFGGVFEWYRSDHVIHAGDIIILHFDPEFSDNFIVALQAIKAAGLTPALLEDYIEVN